MRQLQDAHGNIDIDAIGNLERIRKRFRNILQCLAHFCRARERKIVRFHRQAVFVIDFGICLHRQQNILRFGVLGFQIVRILRPDQWRVGFLGELPHRRLDFVVVRDVRMVRSFKKKIILPKNIFIFRDELFGRFKIFPKKRPGNFSADAAGKRNYPFRMFS